MNKILLSISALIVSLVIMIFAVSVSATTIVGTAGAGDECNVHAADASHTCAPGLVCIPQNDNSEGNGKCGSEATPTPTPGPTATPTPTPGPEQHYACQDNACMLVEGSGDNSCSTNQDCQPNVTPTPTETPNNPGNPGGQGDGGSDNLGCSTHDCSNQAHQPTQAVLGLSTTSGEEMPLIQLFASLIFGATGFKFFKKNA